MSDTYAFHVLIKANWIEFDSHGSKTLFNIKIHAGQLLFVDVL